MRDFPKRLSWVSKVDHAHDRIDALEPLFDALNEKGRMLSDYINAMGVSPLAKEAWKGRVVDLERQVKALESIAETPFDLQGGTIHLPDIRPLEERLTALEDYATERNHEHGGRLESLESHLFGGSQAAQPEPLVEYRIVSNIFRHGYCMFSNPQSMGSWASKGKVQRRTVGEWEDV